ncbi:MAG TPA: substrate-binding domain-containing protein [Methanotrichaceae archaeon]|nr:substrate-binding domain-containing protein [Methanotrichaceae archaeon]
MITTERKVTGILSALMVLMIVGTFSVSAADTTNETRLKIATTTSLYDTGLLNYIQTKFQDEYGTPLSIVSGGTGIAIQYGQRGDVDLLIIHDKARELKFVQDGDGLQRRCIAYNYFVLVGPADDPAGVKGMNATQAFKTILEKGQAEPDKVKFVSRGDNSGTQSREIQIWKAAGYNYSKVNNSGPWYIDAGQGMGATLMMTNEKQAYTLSDTSTFMAYKGNLTIVPLVEGGKDLLNVYVAIAVNPVKHPGANCAMANKFIDYLVSEEGQKIIGDFGRDKYGQALFYPAAGNCSLIGCSSGECAVPTNATCATA